MKIILGHKLELKIYYNETSFFKCELCGIEGFLYKDRIYYNIFSTSLEDFIEIDISCEEMIIKNLLE